MATTAEFPRLELTPAYQRVSQAVEGMISSGRLSAGDWLPTEADLCAQLGVNRSTVREGLRGLEHSGLVKRDGKRLKVAIPHYSELASRASRALVMHQVTFRELWEASEVLETLTAVLAMKRISAEAMEALDNNIKQMAERIGDIDSVISLDIEFHDLIAEAADNRALSLAREPISLLFYPAGKVIVSKLQTQKRILDAHQKIVSLMRQQDLEGLRKWTTRHIGDIKRGYQLAGLNMDSPVDAAK